MVFFIADTRSALFRWPQKQIGPHRTALAIKGGNPVKPGRDAGIAAGNAMTPGSNLSGFEGFGLCFVACP